MKLKSQVSSLKSALKIGEIDLVLPVWLHQDAIDDVDVDGSTSRGSDSREHRRQAQVRQRRSTPSAERMISATRQNIQHFCVRDLGSSSGTDGRRDAESLFLIL